MSVNVDSTLLTGCTATSTKCLALCGTTRRKTDYQLWQPHSRASEIRHQTILQRRLYNLNQVHLSQQVKTLHEELDEKESKRARSMRSCTGEPGRLFADSLSFSMISGLNRSVKSTHQLFRTAVFQSESGQPLAFQKFGFNDRFSTNELVYLIQTNKVPPLALVYFPISTSTCINTGGTTQRGGESRPACSKDLDSFRHGKPL
ncbi:hypothetical protein PO124_19625 [Bacillus licheniformis]|nr:hypothetical protein [Bacillus licheniformis]